MNTENKKLIEKHPDYNVWLSPDGHIVIEVHPDWSGKQYYDKNGNLRGDWIDRFPDYEIVYSDDVPAEDRITKDNWSN